MGKIGEIMSTARKISAWYPGKTMYFRKEGNLFFPKIYSFTWVLWRHLSCSNNNFPHFPHYISTLLGWPESYADDLSACLTQYEMFLKPGTECYFLLAPAYLDIKNIWLFLTQCPRNCGKIWRPFFNEVISK